MDDAATPPGPLKTPAPVVVRLWRAWVVLMVGLAAWLTIEPLRGGALTPPYDTLALVIPAYALATGALSWWLATAPYPDDRMWTRLKQSLGSRERYGIARALLRGRDIAPEDRDYAVARVARQRRSLLTLGPVSAIGWSQVVSVADSRAGTGFFWFILVVAVVITVTCAGSLVLLRRWERTVRMVLADPRRS